MDPDEEEWQVVEELHDDTYEGEASVPDQQIKAVLYDDNHEIIAESTPVTIPIDDHNHETLEEQDEHHHHEGDAGEQVNAQVEIDGLAPHYHTGDSIDLTAIYQHDSHNGHWHWYTLAPDKDEWELVEEMYQDTYEGKATTPGLEIKAVLYDNDHEVIAESNAETIVIDDHTDHDPHIWMDPLRMIDMAEIIKEELTELDPGSVEIYEENFNTLKNKLTELDQRFTDLLSEKENKYIIVPHSAFGYWEERYGVEQITISGLSSSEEPSQKDLVEVMEAAETFDIEYILYEQNSDNRLARVVEDEIGAQNLMIHNLEVRTEEDIENDEDYISLMEYNLEILDEVTK